jgi:hypothetical protein
MYKMRKSNSGLKYPKSSGVADFYRIAVDEDKCHGSEYDTLLTYEIFKEADVEEITGEGAEVFGVKGVRGSGWGEGCEIDRDNTQSGVVAWF